MLKKLCRTYTNLREEDIKILENMEMYLQSISNLVKADIFIDCLTSESGTAIVVSEAKPSNSTSLYMGTVVGKLALMENEPAAECTYSCS